LNARAYTAVGDRRVHRSTEAREDAVSMVRRRSVSAGLAASLLVTVLGMTPITAAADPPLPDPRRPEMPADVLKTQPRINGGAEARGNRVHKLTESDRKKAESSGSRIVESEDGLLVLELKEQNGKRVQLVAQNAKTVSGIEVIGLAFLDEAAIAAVERGSSMAFSFGPQAVAAHRNGTNHSHYPGFPFHTCSFVYNWANGDSTFHICSIDVSLLQYVAAGWSALLLGLFNPVVGFVAGLIVFGGINYYRNADGSIDLFGPNVSIVSHYGNTYYWGSRGGWYYHYPRGSIYYGYARRATNGLLYRTH
jgi:hypothetical protein